MDVYLTGRIEDHVLHYAFEVDGVKRKGNFSTASSELEASASAVFVAIKKVAECYPNAGEIILHTDIDKPFGYLEGKYKPTTDTMKKFVKAVEKLKKDCDFTLQTDKEIPKEKADALYDSAFGSAPEEPKQDAPKEEPKPVPAANPKNAASRWSKGAKVRQEQQTMINSSPAYEPAKTVPSASASGKAASAPQAKGDLDGEWLGWDSRGVMMTYPTFEDAINDNGIPVYANGQTPPADSMGYGKFQRPEQPKAVPKQNTGAGKGWMRKGVVLDENPLDAPKREPKSQAFENWHSGKAPKPKWGAMALNTAGEIVAEISSRQLSESCKKDAEYIADWWEQVDKYTVIREGLVKGKNDFSDKLDAEGNFKGFSMTAVDLNKDKESMTVWKDGVKIYNGGITDEYKQQYVSSHNDERALAWAAELETKKSSAAAEARINPEPQEEEYEQMNMFDMLKSDDPFGI